MVGAQYGLALSACTIWLTTVIGCRNGKTCGVRTSLMERFQFKFPSSENKSVFLITEATVHAMNRLLGWNIFLSALSPDSFANIYSLQINHRLLREHDRFPIWVLPVCMSAAEGMTSILVAWASACFFACTPDSRPPALRRFITICFDTARADLYSIKSAANSDTDTKRILAKMLMTW